MKFIRIFALCLVFNPATNRKDTDQPGAMTISVNSPAIEILTN